MNIPEFKLREMRPSDGAAISRLITEFDGDLTTRFLVDPYQAIVSGTEFQTTGVVVESTGFDGIVGMGTIRFGRAQFNDTVIPFAFLDGLKVHKDFRGNGLGVELANWRVQRARERFGEDCVIATGMLYDNYASHAVASKWSNEFLESVSNVLILPVRSQPPRSIPGMEVREIHPEEYEEFAGRQNAFYGPYNLFSPTSAENIASVLNISVHGRNPYRYYAAFDSRGNLLAGTQTWARGMLKSDTVNELPAPIRMMNKVLHLLPPDLTIREISVHGLWFEHGQFRAAQYLWEMVRWLGRDQGTTITAGFDTRDNTRRVVNVKPWHQPRPQITFALHAPQEIERKKLVFNMGRV